jgi:hypothetical protein
MGVKELRQIIDDESDIYWDGWNAAIEAVASVMDSQNMRATAANVIRPMKRDKR